MSQNSLVAKWLAPIAFALIFVGYFAVWLPNRAAGLAMMGLEIGEWVKFLPGMRWHPETNPNPIVDRNWFYLPPITLSAALLIWSQHWRTGLNGWVIRLLALAASTLALPAINDMIDHPRESLMRMIWVLICGLIFMTVSLRPRPFDRLSAGLLIIAGLGGALLPTSAYYSMIPIISDYTRATPGIGPGVWLNLAGHFVLVIVGVAVLMQQKSDAG